MARLLRVKLEGKWPMPLDQYQPMEVDGLDCALFVVDWKKREVTGDVFGIERGGSVCPEMIVHDFGATRARQWRKLSETQRHVQAALYRAHGELLLSRRPYAAKSLLMHDMHQAKAPGTRCVLYMGFVPGTNLAGWTRWISRTDFKTNRIVVGTGENSVAVTETIREFAKKRALCVGRSNFDAKFALAVVFGADLTSYEILPW